MLCEHRAKLQLSNKLKYGNIKVLGVKHVVKSTNILLVLFSYIGQIIEKYTYF